MEYLKREVNNMSMPKEIVKFLEQNKNKTKKVVIREMIEIFNIVESTAKTYYASRNPNRKTKKEIIFKFFEKNPEALDDESNKKYIKELGITRSTYANYKSQYKMLNIIEAKNIQEWNKYHKGMLRMKFKIDDSKLFG